MWESLFGNSPGPQSSWEESHHIHLQCEQEVNFGWGKPLRCWDLFVTAAEPMLSQLTLLSNLTLITSL